MHNHILYPCTGFRSALTESELQALQSVSGMWNGPIGADDYCSVATCMGYDIREINNQLDTKDFTKSTNMLILIREEIINKPFWIYRATYKLDYDPKQLLTNQGYSKMYDCSSVSGYLLNKNEKR